MAAARILEYSWPEKLRFNRAAGRSFGLLYADLLTARHKPPPGGQSLRGGIGSSW